MYRRILAALLLAFSLGTLCPAVATAMITPRTDSSNHRHRRHRRHHRRVVVIVRR